MAPCLRCGAVIGTVIPLWDQSRAGTANALRLALGPFPSIFAESLPESGGTPIVIDAASACPSRCDFCLADLGFEGRDEVSRATRELKKPCCGTLA